MTILHQIHTTRVSGKTYYILKHQAVDFDFSLAEWASIIFDYISTRPALAEEIFEAYMASNGHADTIPEMPVVRQA